MEQGSIASAPIINNNKKNGVGLKIAVAVASVMAVCGIGFGVYGMVQGAQKDAQISNLKVQIENSDGTITTIDTPEISTSTGEVPTVTINDIVKTSGGPYIENGYFFVPKWGVKYRLSDSLTNYGYAVDQNSQGDSYGDYVVGLTAISKDDYVEQPQTIYYDDIFSCSVVTVRTLEDSKKSFYGDATADVQFNGLDFVIHDLWRNRYCTGGSMAPTDTVAEQLKTILMNPEKI
ncbi:hypothetical protein IJ117_01445 [Candidatus Saccharibacteria bacterium]|nr:hypothetical protein [Candidatus Saccharibacteria bacterium]